MKPSAISLSLMSSLALVFLATGNALACFCELQPEKRVIELSDVVVFGRVTDVEVVGDQKYATVQVERTIKGKSVPAKVVKFVTNDGTAQCGYLFKVSDKPLTIAAKRVKQGALRVDNCAMYSLKRSDRRKARIALAEAKKAEAAAKKAEEEAKRPVIAVACISAGKTGNASCDVVCPANRTVSSCAHSAGSLVSGDTCTSLGRIFAGPTDAKGQPSGLPHDRCRVSAVCSNAEQKISVQGWATCQLAPSSKEGSN